MILPVVKAISQSEKPLVIILDVPAVYRDATLQQVVLRDICVKRRINKLGVGLAPNRRYERLLAQLHFQTRALQQTARQRKCFVRARSKRAIKFRVVDVAADTGMQNLIPDGTVSLIQRILFIAGATPFW